jgi:hypothetical protein
MSSSQKGIRRTVKILIVVSVSLLVCACLFEVKFDALALNTRYQAGNVFMANSIPVEVKAYAAGASSTGDYALVDDGHGISGIVHDMWTRRVGLAPLFAYPLKKVEVLCLAYGVTHYFVVNGESVRFDKSQSLPSQTVAGVAVSDVTQSQNVSRRVALITLTGPVTSFSIGGDELAVSFIKGWN